MGNQREFYTITLLSSIIFSFESIGQSEEKLGSWYIYNGFFNFNPKVELFFETQYRTWAFKTPEIFFIRPYFNYNLTDNFQAGLGLEYHKNWEYAESKEERDGSNEFRTTLQGLLFQKVGRVAVQHRFRYEFRSIDNNANQRTRYRVQLTVRRGANRRRSQLDVRARG